MQQVRKAVFVTGGASGIGRAVAQRFAAEGWLVGIGDVDEAGMDGTAALLPPGRCACHVLDVRDRRAWDTVLAHFVSRAGNRLDVLCNNAGVALGGSFSGYHRDEIDRTVDVNLKGVLWGAQAAYPYLAATPGSCLLNTASASALYGMSGMSVYSATKMAVRALTEALDGEWAQSGIRVRSIMPGFVDTPLLAGRGSAASKVPIRNTLRRAGMEFIAVEEVAEAAWIAASGDRLHTIVGKSASRLALLSRWLPALLRAQGRRPARKIRKR